MHPLENVFLAEWILTISSQSLLILVAGYLFLTICRRKDAPWRGAVSLATLTMIALLPFLHLSFNTLNFSPFKTILHLPAESAAGPNGIQASDAERDESHLSSFPSAKNGDWISRLFGSGSIAVKLINIFGVVWAGGSIFFILSIISGAISIRKLKTGLIPVKDARILRLLDETKRIFMKPVRANIFESAKVPCPMAAGFIKPLILIPYDLLRNLGDVEIKGILLHELSHIHHRDQITGVLQRIVAALAWWNPLVHALSASLSRAREEISDNHVLQENKSEEYAECLINLAERMSAIRRLPIVVTISSSHIALKERVKSILSKERIMETHLKKKTVWGIFLVALIMVASVAGHRLIFAATAETVATTPEKIALEPTGAEPSALQEADKPVKATGNIKAPQLLKKFEPVYPEIARKSKVEGVVILEATTDINGRVVDARVLRSIPLLDQAAIDAIRQWIYEPMIIDGKPRGVIFTVTVRFQLDDKISKEEITAPKVIKMVEPIYPQEARKKGIQGVVILEATIDVNGLVKQAKILRSIPDLDQAAIDAVRQWAYEPVIVDGKSKETTFTLTVNFTLKDKKAEAGTPMTPADVQEKSDLVVLENKPPKMIREVKPAYPEIARQAKVEGNVIVEATMDPKGDVIEARILRSIPLLDQAAIDAVRNCRFEPLLVEGKPRSATFTMSCRFKLKDGLPETSLWPVQKN